MGANTTGTPWPYPSLFAHRGGGTLAPENTLAAIRKGAELGFRAVEFDVKLTAEGVAILMHDETLERTTDGRGEVARTPYAEIARLDAGSWHSAALKGEPVPTFEAAAKLCLQLGLLANVEIKPCPGREAETGRIVARMADRLWAGREAAPLLSSFSEEALRAAREAAPYLPRGLLFREVPSDWQARLEALGCVSLHCSHKHLPPELAGAVKQAGYRLLAYTVNEVGRAETLFALGVDGLFTDALDAMAARFSL